MQQKYCRYCHKPFEGRKNKKFDSDSCRVKYSNLPKRVKLLQTNILRDLERLSRAKREFPHLSTQVDSFLTSLHDDLSLNRGQK